MFDKDLESDCGADCQKSGTRWTLVYWLNGIVLLMLSTTYIVFTFGACLFWARFMGACINFFVSCIHIYAILMTAVFRLNIKGRLAANCNDPSHYEGQDQALSDKWTFRTDSKLILSVWMIQFFLALIFCCLGSLPIRHIEKVNEVIYHKA